MEARERRMRMLVMLVLAVLALAGPAFGFDRRDGELASAIVPSPVPYAVLTPPGYDPSSEPLPLVIALHGGGGSRDNIERLVPALEQAIAEGALPPVVVAMPTVTGRSFYLDFKGGEELWETFILREFIPELRRTYRVRQDQAGLFIMGGSMGGMGSLRLAFREPEMFAAVGALFPGIEPVLAWEQVEMRHRFWRGDALFERGYGKPVDPEHFAINNPATMAARNAERLRASGLQIYLEAGDEDVFLLHEGTEFLHRVLFDHGVRHEYRLLQWEDHGSNYTARNRAIFGFFGKVMNPPAQDARTKASRAQILPLRERAGLPSERFVPSPPLPPTR